MNVHSAKYLAALSSLLTGDLWTDDSEEGLRPEQAALHLASTQAKALLLALDHEQGDDCRPRGWLYGHKWSKNDTITMLSGLVSFLEGSRVAIEELRFREQFVASCDREGVKAVSPEELREEAEEARRAAEACTCEADEREVRP